MGGLPPLSSALDSTPVSASWEATDGSGSWVHTTHILLLKSLQQLGKERATSMLNQHPLMFAKRGAEERMTLLQDAFLWTSPSPLLVEGFLAACLLTSLQGSIGYAFQKIE